MKVSKFLLLLLVFRSSCFGQNIRYDQSFPSITTIGATPYLIANVPPVSPVLAVCHNPANNVPCTNYATTFNGAGVACPNGAQDTPQPSALITACQAVGDARGNIGFWAPAGTYDYTVCVGLTCFGPYTVQLINGGGGAGNPGGAAFQIQTNVAGTSFGGVGNVAAGSILASQGTSAFPVFQTKLTFDARDLGVDCTGTSDNSSLFQTFVNAMQPNTVIVFPASCIVKMASQVNVPSTSGFTLMSAWVRGQNGSGNGQKPEFLWSGSTGGMWNFIANQTPHVEGFAFINGSSAHLDYFLQFDGNPSTYIGTEAWVKGNTFTNNMTNPTVGGAGTFDAIKINTVSGQNHEKNVITDNDFFCSQSRTFTESSSTQITNGSPNVTCGLANCTYTTDATVGERVRISYATASVGTSPGIQDTTILSITDNNHLVLNANSTATATNARIQFGQAYGNGITIGSVNSKHNTLDRNSFTQCARGINMTNGSFSLSHAGGSANDVLVYINDTAEPTQLDYLEDENTLRDLFVGASVDGQITLNHPRNSLGIAGEYDGFIYLSGGIRLAITGGVLQDSPGANQVVIGAANTGNVQLTSLYNVWAPGAATMANLGYAAWRASAEAGNVASGFLISCNDFGIADSPGGACFTFGDGGITAGTNEGNLVVSSDHFGNLPSFSTYTAEPNVQVNTFVNEAKGFTNNFNLFNNSSNMNAIGFDNIYKQSLNGGGIISGFRFPLPVTTAAITASRGLWVKAPSANTNITEGDGVYIEDLSTHTGITNKFAFKSVGASDTMSVAGPITTASQFTSTLSSGTAPFSITSTTPVSNLTTVPATYNHSGTQQIAAHIVEDSCTLGTSCSVTLTGSSVFTSSSSYQCTATDQTGANAVRFAPSSGSVFALTGTGTDVLSYICVGN